MNKYISAALMAAGLQGCLDDSHTGDSGTPTAYPQILFAAQEGSLASFDLASGDALPGVIADVTR